jgi:hypothetical protein
MQSNYQRGNILIVTLVMIVVVSGFVGVALTVTNSSARFADRSRDYSAAQIAADAAVEYGFAAWKRRIMAQNRAITTTEANSGLTAPTFPGFAYSSLAENGPLRIDALDEYGAPISGSPLPVVLDLITYPGWRGRSFSYLAKAKMQMNPGIYSFRAGVRRQFQYAEVPLFQSMFFFENDIEFYKPAEMIISGLVHTNSRAWTSGQVGTPLTFQSDVSYVIGYSHTDDPPFADLWSGWSPNATVSPIYPSGIEEQLHQVSRFEPLGNEPASVLNTTDVNPNNDSMRELIEPPNSGYPDPPQLAARRLYNKAGIVVNINGPTVTVRGQNGVTLSTAKQTELRGIITGSSTIYDQREGRNVDVANIDVGKLRMAVDTGIPGFNNTVYIHDTTPQTGTNAEPKTIRLQKGGLLPNNGLTVVSENPVYIQGDYNTGTTTDPNAVPANAGGNATNTDSPTVPGYTRKPASVISDAVMFLSNSWQDINSNQPVLTRPASNTTYNTGIVSGFMPSGYQPPSGAQYGYSGGANNFPRFLEDWGGDYCTYYGSMVQLYQSKVFTGEWDTGVIFRPPARRWNFDPNFKQVSPPGSLDAVSWSRGTWQRY